MVGARPNPQSQAGKKSVTTLRGRPVDSSRPGISVTGITSGPPGLGFGRISRTGGICGLPGISSSRRGLSPRPVRVRKLRFAVKISVTQVTVVYP